MSQQGVHCRLHFGGSERGSFALKISVTEMCTSGQMRI